MQVRAMIPSWKKVCSTEPDVYLGMELIGTLVLCCAKAFETWTVTGMSDKFQELLRRDKWPLALFIIL